MLQSQKNKFFINRSTDNLSSWDLVPNIYSREKDCTDLRSAECINEEGEKIQTTWQHKPDSVRKKCRSDQEAISHTTILSDRLRRFSSIFFSKEYLKNNMFWKTHQDRFFFSRHKALTSTWQKLKELEFYFLVVLHLLYNLLLVIFFHIWKQDILNIL